MQSFIQRHRDSVIGILNGFDRMRLRGTMRLLAHVGGMMSFLWEVKVLLRDFAAYAQDVTARIRQATEQVARAAGRPLLYLPSSLTNKEERARSIANRENIRQGLICVLSSVEPCYSYDIYRNRETRQIELRRREVKCKHYYHYLMHPVLGFMHVRLQTWFPFTVHVCINGREWLARQMDEAGIGYRRGDNCFIAVENVKRAQALLDRQLRTNWPRLLDGLVRQVNPAYDRLFGNCRIPYYWTLDESEWATDVMFQSPAQLQTWYPQWVLHAIQTMGSREVMRFLGKRVPIEAGIDKAFKGEVVSDLRERPEGMRIKHRVKQNSIKMYDKQGSVLRIETTINDPHDLKVYRPKEGDSTGPRKWRYMRKSVADLYRRAEVCQAANERYLETLAVVQDHTPLKDLCDHLCRSTSWKGRPVRGLHPLRPDDALLLEAVNRGEFLLNGFRNRDLQPLLYGHAKASAGEARRRSAATTRKIRLLRAHGLIHKIAYSHRYKVSEKGRLAITALLAARQADTEKLLHAA